MSHLTDIVVGKQFHHKLVYAFNVRNEIHNVFELMLSINDGKGNSKLKEK